MIRWLIEQRWIPFYAEASNLSFVSLKNGGPNEHDDDDDNGRVYLLCCHQGILVMQRSMCTTLPKELEFVSS